MDYYSLPAPFPAEFVARDPAALPEIVAHTRRETEAAAAGAH